MNPSDDQLIQAIDQAPAVIQESLSGGSAVEFMSSMPKRYGLHVDTAGYVSEFIRNMLLGFLRPEQFMGKLESVGINGDQARKLVVDLNKEVFMPLRDSMRVGGAKVQPAQIPHVPVMNIATPRPSLPEPVPSSTERPSYNLIPAAEPTAEAIPPSLPPIPPPIPAAVSATPSAPAPTVRTMQHDMAEMEQGHMPDPYPVQLSSAAPPAAMPHPSQMTPARAFQTASVPFTSTPPAPQPVPVPSEPVVRAPQVLPASPVVAARAVPLPIAEPSAHSGDPYREPI